jgi:hypothetical protein
MICKPGVDGVITGEEEGKDDHDDMYGRKVGKC